MVGLKNYYKKLLEAKNIFGPYGSTNAVDAFYFGKGLYGGGQTARSAVGRYGMEVAYGLGQYAGSGRSTTETNKMNLQGAYSSTVSKAKREGRAKSRSGEDYKVAIRDPSVRHGRLSEEKLRVFDFDDTVAMTSSNVKVKDKNTGKTRTITPAEFAKYKPAEHEELDFSEFDRVSKPKRVTEIHRIIRNLVKKGRPYTILTARHNKARRHIVRYLKDQGLHLPDVRVETVGSSDPQAKANHVAKRLKTGKYTHVEFFDDSEPNVSAISGLSQQFPKINIKSRVVKYAEKNK